MSHGPSATALPSKYQVIFDEALKTYRKKTGKDLKSDPLLRTLEACQSANDTLSELRRQIPGFDQSENTDDNLTNWVDPVVNVLYIFAQTIGGAVGLVSNPGAVIFTAISSLLSIVMAARAVKPTITDLFESIKQFFVRLRIYVELPPTEEMTEIIVDVMVHVLHILALLTKEIKQGNIKRFVKKLAGKSDLEDALRRFEKLTLQESRMVNAQGLKVTHGVDAGVKVAINKVDAVLDGGENMRVELHQVARGISDLSKDVNDEKRNLMRQNFAKWLSSADPFINFNTANEAHYEGTAEWFTQSKVFKNWKESGSLLWIHGKPGSGKSVLSSTIIQDINGICDTGTGHLAFFFFDFKDAGKQNARALLSSIIVQLSNRSVGFFDVLLAFYSSHQDGKQQPSISSLTQCLEDMLEVREELPIYLIIDAIDECPNTTGMPSSRDQVMSLLEKLVTLELPNLHICITSRPEADIRTCLEPLTSTSNSISLHDESGQKQDIINFVTSTVRTDKMMRRWREADKELVINTLSEKAGGMFRWIFCQLEMLRRCLAPSVRRILEELPKTLDETYERILQAIPKSNRIHAHRLLQCLAVAFRPLHVEELAEVIAIDFDEAGGVPKLNEDLRWEDQEQAVLSACSSLVTVVGFHGSRVVQFSHFSVKEFLTSDRLASRKDVSHYYILLEPAHTIMAQACLGVLVRLDHRIDEESINGKSNFPLARYAADHIGDHMEFGNVVSRISDEIDYFLDRDQPHFAAWLWLRESVSWGKSSEALPLYYVAEFGFCGLVKHLVLKRTQDTSTRGQYGMPLHIALCKGHAKVSQLLLDYCEDVDVRDPDNQTPLHIAAERGLLDVIRTLLNRDADINAQDNRGRTPLFRAITWMNYWLYGDEAGPLPLHKTDAQTRNTSLSIPLRLELSTGSVGATKLLLDNGANVHVRDDKGQTPLHRASDGNHVDVIRLLLQHGTGVDVQDNDYSTALHLASDFGGPEAVRLLLENGANPNIRNDKGQTPLHLASEWNHVERIRLLLNYGADVDAQDNDHFTPLHLATYHRSLEAAQLLLEHRARIDSDVRNNEGQTPLHLASASNNGEIIRLLQGLGETAGAKDNDC